MKVQMQGQALRVRISEAELARLQSGETAGNLTRLPGGATFHQEVRLVDDGAPSLLATGRGWVFNLPRGVLEPYVARLPCRDGIEFRLPVGEGVELAVEFEVDVRDSVRSRGTVRRGLQSRGAPDLDSD